MAELTLPGTLPGLLQMCSRVRHDDGRRGTVVALSPGGSDSYPEEGSVLVCFDGAWDACPEEVSLELLGLDLTDATGRAHAEWWLAAASGCPTHQPALETYSVPLDNHFEETGLLVIFGSQGHAPDVEGLLDHLYPNDPRLLPDGSRWVDAEALRLVCLAKASGMEVACG